MNRILMKWATLCMGLCLMVSCAKEQSGFVTIYPEGGQAKVVRLQVVNDQIIRVQATSAESLPQKQSLIVVPQTVRVDYDVQEDAVQVTVKTRKVKAVISKATGEVTFYDADGNVLLKEAEGGKKFQDFIVPEREIGMGTLTEEQRHGLTWNAVFESPADEAFYGLGQHQSEELNMKGRNEDLFQYNTKVSVPFVISNKNYGLLWDSYSYGRFGNPHEYMQLGKVFKLYDKNGQEGHLTGTYIDRNRKTLVRQEDSIFFEYALPEASEIGKGDHGGIQNFPKGFNLSGANVVYEGALEAKQDCEYQFILYYAGYTKVFFGDEEVVPERWRTAWNPNAYKFEVTLKAGVKTPLRIEWQPDGGVSYMGLRVS